MQFNLMLDPEAQVLVIAREQAALFTDYVAKLLVSETAGFKTRGRALLKSVYFRCDQSNELYQLKHILVDTKDPDDPTTEVTSLFSQKYLDKIERQEQRQRKRELKKFEKQQLRKAEKAKKAEISKQQREAVIEMMKRASAGQEPPMDFADKLAPELVYDESKIDELTNDQTPMEHDISDAEFEAMLKSGDRAAVINYLNTPRKLTLKEKIANKKRREQLQAEFAKSQAATKIQHDLVKSRIAALAQNPEFIKYMMSK